MTTFFEYGVDLTDNQKSKLASVIKKKFTSNSSIKTSHLRGSDELMLTKRQIAKIQKSIANGTGTDIKISSAQIGKSVKHGGNLFPSLATLGAKVLPYAVKGISKLLLHWQLVLFLLLVVLELKRCLEKEFLFQRNTFQC